MKKHVLLFLVLTIIACSSDEDNEPGVTTDPLIGTWITGQGGDTGTMVVNRNGSLTVDYTYEDIDEEDETFSGT